MFNSLAFARLLPFTAVLVATNSVDTLKSASGARSTSDEDELSDSVTDYILNFNFNVSINVQFQVGRVWRPSRLPTSNESRLAEEKRPIEVNKSSTKEGHSIFPLETAIGEVSTSSSLGHNGTLTKEGLTFHKNCEVSPLIPFQIQSEPSCSALCPALCSSFSFARAFTELPWSVATQSTEID
jgi:hypothetical protein